MPNYQEIYTYVMGQIQLEMATLRAANIRWWHSLAIIRTIPPTDLDRHYFLWIVDWCRFDIDDTECRIRLWREKLYWLWRANRMFEF